MDLMLIANVERVQGAAGTRGPREVFFILPPDRSRAGCGDHVKAAGTKTAYEVPVHGILVEVQTKTAHRGLADPGKISSMAASSAAISLSISSRFAR